MRMAAAREVVERYIAEGRPAYGLTTGLGARVVESLPSDALAEFSRHTVLGRANSVGAPLPTEVVRAAVLVRANGLAHGGSGARPELADALLALLEHGVHPIVPSIGSIGAGDICVLAHIALVLIGEGEAEFHGELMPGVQALAAAKLEPLDLAPKDGLAVISSNAVSVACAALALVDGRAALEAAHAAAALSFEGFRASLTPLDDRVVEARPAPGQATCAAALRTLLAGGSLATSGGRRLQDPLSFRCVSQVHGSLATALELLSDALEPELNGAGDNPLVLVDARRDRLDRKLPRTGACARGGRRRTRTRTGREPDGRARCAAARRNRERPPAESRAGRLDGRRDGAAAQGGGRARC